MTTTNIKNVLITGVSTGIGYATTEAFIKKGYRVFGSVRKEEDALRLKNDLGELFVPLLFDVTDDEGIEIGYKRVKEIVGDDGLYALVNNAGIAQGGPIQYQSMAEIKQHFDVNVFGVIKVTKTFLPLLGAVENHDGPKGRIINISSVAGRLGQPFVGAYVASKHALEGFSHSLRRELLIYGVDVIIIGPGAVKTPIWDKGIKMDGYKNTPYSKILEKFARSAKKGGEDGLSPDVLADNIVSIVESKAPKTRYAFLNDKLKNWNIPMMMSDRMLDGVIKKLFGIK